MKKITKDYTPYAILVIVTAFVSFSFGFFASYVKANDTVAMKCVKETSVTWNQLQLLKEDIEKNLINEINFIQQDLQKDNQERRTELGL